MRVVKAKIDSIPIILHKPETLLEYREGVRGLGGSLHPDHGMLFDFSINPTYISMENSGVNCDLTLLFFLFLGKHGVVSETLYLTSGQDVPTSSKGVYSYVLELRKDFCDTWSIKQGSILTLGEDI